MSKWIKVTDRLPPDFHEVQLFSSKFNRQSVGCFINREDGLFVSFSGKLAHVEVLDRGVTHWAELMPSPVSAAE